MEKENIVALFSIFATICGTLSRGPQVYRVYTTKPLSINDLSTNTMILVESTVPPGTCERILYPCLGWMRKRALQ